MGKIKSKTIKRASKELIEKGIEFTKDFKKNKKILGNNMPSKKLRNQLAGLLIKIEKRKDKKI